MGETIPCDKAAAEMFQTTLQEMREGGGVKFPIDLTLEESEPQLQTLMDVEAQAVVDEENEILDVEIDAE